MTVAYGVETSMNDIVFMEKGKPCQDSYDL